MAGTSTGTSRCLTDSVVTGTGPLSPPPPPRPPRPRPPPPRSGVDDEAAVRLQAVKVITRASTKRRSAAETRNLIIYKGIQRLASLHLQRYSGFANPLRGLDDHRACHKKSVCRRSIMRLNMKLDM